MGNNLSSTFVPDTSAVVLSDIDRASDIKMLMFWAITLQGCAMIFSTCRLIDRWKGPYDRNKTGFGHVLMAFILSSCWPMVLIYLWVSGRDRDF